MMPQHHLPADIERTSMKIIAGELAQRGLDIPPENAPVVKRVIHTTADFDYAQTLHFTPGAVAAGIAAMHAGATIITDTNMALAGITKPGLAKLGGQALCFMADPAQGCGRIPRRRAGRGQRPHRPADDCREN